jgi:5-methylcytosine-specific restriction endonuclease McrA
VTGEVQTGGGAPLMIPLWVVQKMHVLDADAYGVLHMVWEHVQTGGLPGRLHIDDLPGATQRRFSKARLDKALAQLHRHETQADDNTTVKLWFDLVDDHVVLAPWWRDLNPPPAIWQDDTERHDRRVRRELKSAKFEWLRTHVRQRDRNLCRYCGIRVKWDNHNGDQGATHDHLDPDGENTRENVCISCRRCNGRKGRRTPEQWVLDDPKHALTLLPAGTLAADAATARARWEPPPDAEARARPKPSSSSAQTAASPRTGARTGATPPRAEPEPDRAEPATLRPDPTRPAPPSASRTTDGPNPLYDEEEQGVA